MIFFCAQFCLLGKKTGPVRLVMSEIPWNGMCYEKGGTVVNRFGLWEKACPKYSFKECRGKYTDGPSLADPAHHAMVSIFPLLLKPMRHELRDAGRSEGYESLAGTFVGKYFMEGFPIVDFVIMPVKCAA